MKKDAVTIRAETDSIAYLEAYQKYCISEKVARDMKEALGSTSSVPKYFKLIDEKGDNIALTIGRRVDCPNHGRVCQRRGVADFTTFGNIAQQATHDLSRPRLR